MVVTFKSERANLSGRVVVLNNNNNGVNSNNNINNNGRSLGIVRLLKAGTSSFLMVEKTTELYSAVCSFENLELAYKKARKGKTQKDYVIKFEEHLDKNLLDLRNELLFLIYKPKPLETFILRDPKTRKINKSDFRDRIIHHALCNIIEPLFEKTFIFDSYANRIGKGTFNAIKRLNYFMRKVSKNNSRNCFVLKADVRHYFETVDQDILLQIISRKITNENILWLIKQILKNYESKEKEKGMPLGNLTSQFFANVYLNELDQFVKHKLKAKYYIRYVDDFIILHNSKKILRLFKEKIDEFLRIKLNLELHPDKSKILNLNQGISFLGFRNFYHHKLVRRKNIRKFEKKFFKFKELYKKEIIEREKVIESFEGWLAFITHANTYKYRKHLIRTLNKHFPIEKQKEITNIKKHENHIKKTEASKLQFSTQKTLCLFTKGLSIAKISKVRNIKQATVWEHLANLVEFNQLSIWKLLSKEKIIKILKAIKKDTDKLKEINNRLDPYQATYDEINCVLSYHKNRNKKKNICFLINWLKKVNCYRKCHSNSRLRKNCETKLDFFVKQHPNLKMKRNEFLSLFNNHLTICKLPKKQKKAVISWKEFKKNYKNNN